MGYLVSENYRSQTVKSYISAIKSVLLEIDVELSENKFLLSALTRACKLCNDVFCTRLLIRIGMLNIFLDRTMDHFESINQAYLAILYCTILATMFYGLFRVGEVVTGDHLVKVTDVHIASNKQKILFILRTSKTHGKGSYPQMIKITSKGSPATSQKRKLSKQLHMCPYWLL